MDESIRDTKRKEEGRRKEGERKEGVCVPSRIVTPRRALQNNQKKERSTTHPFFLVFYDPRERRREESCMFLLWGKSAENGDVQAKGATAETKEASPSDPRALTPASVMSRKRHLAGNGNTNGRVNGDDEHEEEGKYEKSVGKVGNGVHMHRSERDADEHAVHGGNVFPATPPRVKPAPPGSVDDLVRSLPRKMMTVRYATTRADLKGEDRYDIRPLMMKTTRTSNGKTNDKIFSYFAVLDGHNGQSCVDFAVHNLLLNILESVDGDEEWADALPQAMVNGFVKTHRDFATLKQLSGTTATAVIVDGLNVYVAGAGDSSAILDDGKNVYPLTVDHRVDTNREERERILRGGGTIKRVEVGGTQHGPLRVDGTLCVSRSLGDIDVSALVSESPDICVVKLPPSGGRIIIASDGVWDAVNMNQVAKLARKYPSDLTMACERVVKKALKAKGFRDDTTVLIVDVLPIAAAPSGGEAGDATKPTAVPDFKECIRLPSSARKAPVLKNYDDIVPTLSLDSKARMMSKKFHELDGIKVKKPVGLYGAFSEDGFAGKKPSGGTNLYSYNRGVAMAQHNLEQSRLRGKLRDGNKNDGDEGVHNLAARLDYNTVSPEMGQLRGYPQRILVHKLSSFVQQ